MIISYCKKCKLQFPGDTCPQCGKRLSPAAQRNIISILNRPLRDGRIWKAATLVLLSLIALLLLFVFIPEVLKMGEESAARVWNSGLPQLIFALFPLGLILVAITLSLQGTETIVYYLDTQGCHLQTWHAPSHLKSWSRLQTRDRHKDLPQQDGSLMHLSQERHMLWQDVQSVKYQESRACILLYHTPHCAPMVLRLPAEEYALAHNMVLKYCKGK